MPKVLLIFFLLLVAPAFSFAQDRKALTLEEIILLIRDGVSAGRVAEVIEKHGIGFELDETVARRLRQAGANEAILSAIAKMAERYKAEEQRKKALEAARYEEIKKKEAEEARRREEEARQRAQAERKKQQEEARRKAEEEKRSVEEARRKQQEQERRQEEEKRRSEEAKKREEEARKRRELALKQPPTAPAPACVVGLRLQFRYDDGSTFRWQISGREGELCIVGVRRPAYYDKNWVLVKQVEEDGQAITSARPTHPLIQAKWLDFPLAVGKKWEKQFTQWQSGSNYHYTSAYTVLSYEEVNVPAGKFMAFKIKEEQTSSSSRWGVRYFWYAPEVGYYVKRKRAPEEGGNTSYWATVKDYELASISRPQ